MNRVEEGSEPLPQHNNQKKILLIAVISACTLAAIAWALSDTGKMSEEWAKLAIIFFTWLTAVMTAWALSHPKE